MQLGKNETFCILAREENIHSYIDRKYLEAVMKVSV